MVKRLGMRRLLARAGIILGVFAVVVAVAAPRLIRGRRFGRLVERMLPDIQGRIRIGGGSWTWSALGAWARGRAAPFEIEDLLVTDPEGNEVLRVARLTGRVLRSSSAPSSSASRSARILVEDLRVERAAWRFAQMKRGGVGFLTALAPPVSARGRGITMDGARAGAGPSSRVPALAVVGARLEGLDATFDLEGWGLALRDVHAAAALSVSPDDRERPFTFEVRDAEVRAGGRLRVLGGTRAPTLPFERARLDRVATTRAAPDEILLQASGLATGRSRLAIDGKITGVYGVSVPPVEPGIDLHATVVEATDALRAVASSRSLAWPVVLGTFGTRIELGFLGPFARLRIDGLAAVVSPNGGAADADFHLDMRSLAVGLSFTHFSTIPLLPAPLVALGGGSLQGRARGRFGWQTRSLSIESLALTLTRPAGGASPRVVNLQMGSGAGGSKAADERGGAAASPAGWTLGVSGAHFASGILHLPRLSSELWGGRLSISGWVGFADRDEAGSMAPPRLDLILNARGLSAKQVLGETFVDGEVSFRARARGRLDDLSLELTFPARRSVRVLGEAFALPARVSLQLIDQELRISTLSLGGPRGSAVSLSGHVDTSGQFDFEIGVDAFPLDRLPGVANTALPLGGRINGHLRLSGELGQPALAGQIRLDAVTFQGRPVGNGQMTISPESRGAIRASGRLIEGIDVEGTLATGRGGLAGDATLVLRRLRLDPFLAALPPGLAVAGVLSGEIGAHLRPGQAPSAEGRLTQLTLTTISPRRPGRAAAGGPVRPLELHSDGEIQLSAQSGGGPIHLGPARFRGSLGVFEIEAQSRGDALGGTLRGRLAVDAFAPMTAAWLDRLSGTLDLELRAARSGLRAPLRVNGQLAIAAPLSGRGRGGVPFDMRIPAGRLSLMARIDDAWNRPVFHAAIDFGRLDLGRLDVDTTLFGNTHIAVTAGRIELEDRTLTLREIALRVGDGSALTIGGAGRPAGLVLFDSGGDWGVARVDIPVRGELGALGGSGMRLDRAALDLRLSGEPRRTLLLGGDVDIAAAHVSSSARLPRMSTAGSNAASSPGGSAEAARVRLDLHVHSGPRGIEVDVPHVPDVHVGVDYHVGGTLASPEASGGIRGAGTYSRAMLWLGKLLH